MYLEHFSLIVADYDVAIEFFVDKLGFELVEDSPALTTTGGRPKRWHSETLESPRRRP